MVGKIISTVLIYVALFAGQGAVAQGAAQPGLQSDGQPSPSQARRGSNESFERYGQQFDGKIARSYEESKEWWPEAAKPRPGTPNVLIVLMDDLGYAQVESFGGLIKTPNLNALADNGLRYNNFHATPLCSPSRAAMFSGRNAHKVGFGSHATMAMGFPGYNALPPASGKAFAKHLKAAGFVNYALGKWDHTPLHEVSEVGPFDRWPSGEGFDHFYGFMAADADNYRSLLWTDHTPVESWKNKKGYHLTEDLADKAIHYITSHASLSKGAPFMMYWGPSAVHAPHHAPKEYIKRYKGKFDQGWDKAREIIHGKQLAMGLIPVGTKLSPRPKEIPAWDSLTAEQKKMYARQMEVFAAMVTHTDEQIGRIVDALRRTGQLDNTVIIFTSDNGASGEGGMQGSHNEALMFNGHKETPIGKNIARYDEWGGPSTYPHYAAGWAMAGNTPFKYFKQTAHRGGIHTPTIIHWPNGIKAKGEIRSQYHHIIDIAATVFDVTKTDFRKELDGVRQMALDGVSMSYSFDSSSAPSVRKEQYYELLGSRSIYKDGWEAVTIHANRMPWDLGGTAPFEPDVWELYKVSEDFSQSVNLADKNPEKLNELKTRWDELAWENNVYPLYDNAIKRWASYRHRVHGDQKVFTYYAPGAARIGEQAAAPTKNRSHSISTSLNLSGGEEGVIVAQGGLTGGFALFVKDGRLHYQYNAFNDDYYTLKSPALQKGKVSARFKFISTGRNKGIGELYVNEQKVDQVEMANMVANSFSLTESLDVGLDAGTPASKMYRDHFPFTGKLDKVTITLE